MNPYTALLHRVLSILSVTPRGLGVVIVYPGEHERVADVLRTQLQGARCEVLSTALITAHDSAHRIALGLPKMNDIETLDTLNGQRTTVATRSLFILVVTYREFMKFQQHAGDARSISLFIERVGFVPQGNVDEERARESLRDDLVQHVGRLDLRGFVRSEQEDVCFSVEQVFQTTFVTPRSAFSFDRESNIPFVDRPEWTGPSADLAAVFEVQKQLVVLGNPGSGKTFFLRWLALNASVADRLCGVRAPFPLIVPLSAYALQPTDVTLLEHITTTLLEKNQPTAHILARLIEEGRAVFLLDGLDEVGDISSRGRTAEAIRALKEAVPKCLLMVTSRIVGYVEAPTELPGVTIDPFTDDQISAFLVRWCELYRVQLQGYTDTNRKLGREEGARLAIEVNTHTSIHPLARVPLLLTVIAIVHRAGLQLPEHRIELYEHIFRVLVERWNRVRSLSQTHATPPIGMADAQRLLGPVALRMMEQDGMLLTRTQLERLLERVLQEKRLKSLTSVSETIELFRTNLGLLVEQGPDLFGMLHLTLVEFLAARELQRSGQLDTIINDPRQVFNARWCETLLLLASDLGVLRADDRALDTFVTTLCDASKKKIGRPSATVPSLLARLLADDPNLSAQSASALINALIPSWWFEKGYVGISRHEVLSDALSISPRLSTGRHAAQINLALQATYANTELDKDRWMPGNDFFSFVGKFARMLESFSVDWGPTILNTVNAWRVPIQIPLTAFSLGDKFVVRMSKYLYDNPNICPNLKLILRGLRPAFPNKPWDLILRDESPWKSETIVAMAIGEISVDLTINVNQPDAVPRVYLRLAPVVNTTPDNTSTLA